jgi:rhodanese-related sulfurtransferase
MTPHKPETFSATAPDAVQSATKSIEPNVVGDGDGDGVGVTPEQERRLVVQPAATYAGDISPELAWAWVQSGEAVLVDVRTDAERAWVGFVPGAQGLAWKQWPGMAINPDFDAGVQSLGANGQKLVLLCRSGVRSIAAAQRATELGLQAYNILEGFEGDLDDQAHRGVQGGWRKHGLPWRQS